MEFKDYYQILGVDKTADADAIKKAYRKLARKYHPDVSKEADAEVRMKEVNEAYAVLGDVEKRAAYDQLGGRYQDGQDFQPPPGWDNGFEFSGGDFSAADLGEYSDFFANLFGQAGRGRHRQGWAGLNRSVARIITPRSSSSCAMLMPGLRARSPCAVPVPMPRVG